MVTSDSSSVREVLSASGLLASWDEFAATVLVKYLERQPLLNAYDPHAQVYLFFKTLF